MIWRHYYVVVEKIGFVSSKIKDELTCSAVKAHAEHLKTKFIQDWIISTGRYEWQT